ncbi:MAG: phosphatase PAP2 family protein [Dehalococcoidia bacterium]|nr:phosphatase PAP2 family protein [Dehalococcoidia bacterium]
MSNDSKGNPLCAVPQGKYVFLIILGVLAFLTIEAVRLDWFSWDLAITEWIQRVDAEDFLGPLVNFNNRMGVVGVAGITGLAAIVWLWLKGQRAEAVFVGLVGVADFLNPVLRYLIDRPRPATDLVVVYRPNGDCSFPSGTAMHVFMFCGILIYLVLRLFKPGFWRTAICVLLGLYIPMMGLWLIYRGIHWPSDVLGGYIYGAVFLWAIIWGHQRYIAWRRRYPRDHIPVQCIPAPIRPFAWILKMVY